MTYDPRTNGAKCDQCFLFRNRAGGPVPSEINPGAEMVIVGEAPGEQECKEYPGYPDGRPFIGNSGAELDKSLAVSGIRRSNVSLVNSLACRPEKNELELALHRHEGLNKKREKQGLPVLPDPFDCCRPRFLADIAAAGGAGQNIIAVGKRGAAAVFGKRGGSILSIRGGPVTMEDGRKVMPTLHPAFVLRAKRWIRAFRGDINRAVNWFRGRPGWKPPTVIHQPTPAQLRDYLRAFRGYSYDTETRSPIKERPELAKECLIAKLGIIGFYADDGADGLAMIVQVLSKDYVTRLYSPADEEEINNVIREWALNPNILKIDFHGYYDVPVLQNNLGVTPAPRLDGIVLHRIVESELPHGLFFVASVNTEIPYSWKLKGSGVDPETDEEWRVYNSFDVALTYRSIPPMMQALELRGQQKALDAHHAIQRYCVGMHRVGLWVNKYVRGEWDVKLRSQAIEQIKIFREALVLSGLSEEKARNFNPQSTHQLKDLFYETWSLQPVEYSKKTGEPSTGDDSIREFMKDKVQPKARKDALAQLRKIRATTKLRGTYVRKMIPWDQQAPKDDYSYDADEENNEDEMDVKGKFRKQKKGSKTQSKSEKKPWGMVQSDGRVHGNFNSHTPLTGRLAHSEPNLANFPRPVRNVIAPWPGKTHELACSTQPTYIEIEVSEKDQKTGEVRTQKKMVPGEWLRDASGSGWNRNDPMHVFIYADEDQLEMRLIAAFAGIRQLLEVFDWNTNNPGKKPKDPHSINGEAFFGQQFIDAKNAKDHETDAWKQKEAEAKFNRLRDFSKIGFYAGGYGATFDTWFDLIVGTEDDKGNLPFISWNQRMVRAIYDRWMEKQPELPKWWEAEKNLFKFGRQRSQAEIDAGVIQQGPGFLADCLFGFRCDFLDGVEEREGDQKHVENQLNNWRSQCVPSFVRVITKDGYLPIGELVGKRFKAWTGKKWAWATAIQKGVAALKRVNTDRGDLYCDASHSFLVPQREGGHHEYDWRRAEKLKSNQRVAMDLAKPLEFGSSGDEEDAYHVGLYIADGSATFEKYPSKRREVALQFAIGDKGDGINKGRGGEAQVMRLKNWGKERGLTFTDDQHEGCKQVSCYSGGLAWLESWGVNPMEKALSKRVPSVIWRSSLAVRKAFLRGFLDGDGTFNKKRRSVTINLCQRQLLEELSILFRTVGVSGGAIHGPYKSDKKGHISFKLELSGTMAFEQLGWGAGGGKLVAPSSPWWVCRDVLSQLQPKSLSDKVIASRIKCEGKAITNPYILTRMGATGLYDHATVSSVSNRKVVVPVYTLMVEDGEHRYVANGFIAKNSTGSSLVHQAAIDLTDGVNAPLGFEKYGPGTGLVNQGHDRLDFELPTFHPRAYMDPKKPYVGWCEPGCRCPLEQSRLLIEEAMTRKGSRRVPGLPVDFTAGAKVTVGMWT